MHPTNHTKAGLADGGRVFGARANSFSPDLVEVYGGLGLDFAWLDIEHGGPSIDDATTLGHLVRAATVGDIDLMIRLPSNDPAVVRKTLDTDHEDASVLVGTMIENRTAVENIEEILSVPGVGFAYLGPGDLAVSLGHPGETDHPEVQEAVETAREACIEAGVPIGVSTTSVDGAREALDAGHRIVRLGDEMEAVRELVGERLAAVGDGD